MAQVKFSLGGDRGLDIFESGYPISKPVSCGSFSGPGDSIETVTAGSSGLQYDPASGQYTYIWRTSSNWGNTCRTLNLKLKAGSEHLANFQFKK